MTSKEDDVPPLHLSPDTGDTTNVESAGSSRKKGKKKKLRELSPTSRDLEDSKTMCLAALMEKSKRQAAKATEALAMLQAATADMESAKVVPDKEPVAEPIQVDQPAAKPSASQSKEMAKKGTSGAARTSSVDSTKATPAKVAKPKPKDSGKGTRVKASASTRPPPTVIEPAMVEHGAVEEQVPDGPTGAIAAEVWEMVTRKVKGRLKQPDPRPPPA